MPGGHTQLRFSWTVLRGNYVKPLESNQIAIRRKFSIWRSLLFTVSETIHSSNHSIELQAFLLISEYIIVLYNRLTGLAYFIIIKK